MGTINNKPIRVKFIKLIHTYEEYLVNKEGKYKKDYIGQVGIIINITRLNLGELYDVQFDDGQVWCLDIKQFYQYKR